jgi:hypothetical protein
MTAPRRRWSCSLRTLFGVVTVAAICLSYVAYIIQWSAARCQFRQAIFAEEGRRRTFSSSEVNAPWQLRVLHNLGIDKRLGFYDLPIGEVLLYRTDPPALWQRARTLFPEANVKDAVGLAPFEPDADAPPATRADRP